MPNRPDNPTRASRELIREARVAGLRNFTTPSLEDVERRRWQLWSVAFFALVGLGLALFGLSFYDDVLPAEVRNYTSMPWLRIAMMGVIITFCLYTAEKEVHLRRLTRILVDERVLTAALSNRLKEISHLSEVGKALNSVLDIDDVLGIILNSCLELLEGSDGSIMLMDDDGQTLVVVCSRGQESSRLGATQTLGTGVAGWVALHREPLLLSGDADPEMFAALVPKDRAILTALCVPLVSRNELLGVLNVNDMSGTRRFSEYDLRAMCMFAEHAAIAISNARLYQVEREHVARLLEVDRLKSEFVATVSHELRTPLTSILGSASTLQRKAAAMTDEQRTEFLSMIERQGKRLLRLIEDILFASRIEAGENNLRREQLDLADLVGEVVESVRTQHGGERLNAELPAVPTLVHADQMAVQQILYNLIENALKYAPGPDPIVIAVTPDASQAEACISVIDRGPGISGDDMPRVFDRFHQGDGSIRRKAPGVGLGLYIVRNLVEGLDGHVWCEPTPGGGATFRFTLPTYHAADVADASAVAAERAVADASAVAAPEPQEVLS